MSSSRGLSALSLAGGVLLVGVGALVVSRSLPDLPGVVLGALLIALGLLSLAQNAVRDAAGRGSRAEVGTGPDGSPVTVVTAPASSVLLPLLSLAVVTVAFGLWAWAAWQDTNPLLAIILAAVALLSLVALVPPLAQGARPDRVELGATDLTTEHFGRRTQVSWEDVHGCVPPSGGMPLALVLRHGADPTVVSRGWPLWRHPSAPDRVEAVVVDNLPVRPELLARVIATCAADRSLRPSLGTDASCDWLTFPPVRDGDEPRPA